MNPDQTAPVSILFAITQADKRALHNLGTCDLKSPAAFKNYAGL